MNSAKNVVEGSVEKILSHAGQHETEVQEVMAPAVTQETVERHRLDEVTTVVDKEIHQDHYHTTIQPIQDVNVLPEQHTHEVVAIQERSFEHGDDKDVQLRLQQEQAKFQDSRIEGETIRETTTSPTMVGEHVHHHLHEIIQPVIQRSTVESTVVHTVVPIHEVHHTAPQIHDASALPAITMEQFKAQGGSLSGREARTEVFEGEPTGFSGESRTGGSTGLAGDNLSGSTSGYTSDNRVGSTGLSGENRTGATGGLSGDNSTSLSGTVGSSYNENSTAFSNNNSKSPLSATGSRNNADYTGDNSSGLTGTGSSGVDSSYDDASTTTKKPSLLDRLNPMKDSNGDGKKGFMQ